MTLNVLCSGLPLIRPPCQIRGVASFQAIPLTTPKYALGSILWKWSQCRGGLISGVQIRGSSLYVPLKMSRYNTAAMGTEMGSESNAVCDDQVKKNQAVLSQNWKATVQSVEVKFLFIPIFFILLRIWSLLFLIIVVQAGYELHCGAIKFFIFIGVSGISSSHVTRGYRSGNGPRVVVHQLIEFHGVAPLEMLVCPSEMQYITL